MSNAALTWAFPIPVVGPTKAVLIALAEHADEQGGCWPSIARLVLFSGFKERAVRNAIRDLEKSGLVRTQQSNGRTSNRYILAINAAYDAGFEHHDEHRNPAPHADQEEFNPARHAVQPGTTCRNPARHTINPAPHAAKPLEPSITLNEPPSYPEHEHPTPVDLFASPPPQPLPSPAKLSKQTARKSQVRADFWPDDAGIVFANSRNVPVAAEVPRFIANHQQRGSLMADWAAAWRTWCMNFAKFAAKAPVNGHKPPNRRLAAMAAVLGNGARDSPPPHAGQTIDLDPDDWRTAL